MPGRSTQPQRAPQDLGGVLPVEQWTRRHFHAVRRWLAPEQPEKAGDRAARGEALGPWLGMQRPPRCLSGVVRVAEQAQQLLEIDTPLIPPTVLPIESMYSTRHFAISYTTEPGPNQVIDPDRDTAVTVRLASGKVVGRVAANAGAPDYVKMLGVWLEYALSRYAALGFRSPLPGDGMIPVRVMGPSSYTSTRTSSIVIACAMGNHQTQYNQQSCGLGVTPGHELFHLVQDQYQTRYTDTAENFWESTARWSESLLNPVDPRYVLDIRDYLLAGGAADDCFTSRVPYRAPLFYRYLTEQFQAEAGTEARVMQRLWEQIGALKSVDYDTCLEALDRTIRALRPDRDLPEFFHEFAVACFAKDYPMRQAERRYRFKENRPRRPFGMYPRVPVLESVPFVQAVFSLNTYGFAYYRYPVQPGDHCVTLHVRRPGGGDGPFFYSVLRLREARIVGMQHGPFPGDLDLSVELRARERVDGLVVLVGSRANLGELNLWLSLA